METHLSKAAAAMGRKGGRQRMKNLTKEEISAISRKAGLASAEKRKRQKQQEETKQ